MTTTLTIDDDVMAAAQTLAEEQRRSVGEVISELSRRGLHPDPPPYTIIDGIPVLTVRDPRPITLEMVNQLRDEL